MLKSQPNTNPASVRSRQQAFNKHPFSESGEGFVSPAYNIPKGKTPGDVAIVAQSNPNFLGTIRKLDLFGKSTNKKLFCYPDQLDALLSQNEQVKLGDDKILQTITCGIFEAIGTIKLGFSDGSETPQFGTESGQQLKCSLEMPVGEKITMIRVRHTSEPASI